MPNIGLDNCGNCFHFDSASGHCNLRDIHIDEPRWTTCANCGGGEPSEKPNGPVIDIVYGDDSDDSPYANFVRVPRD